MFFYYFFNLIKTKNDLLRTNIGGVSSDFSTKHLAKTFKKWEQFLIFKKIYN